MTDQLELDMTARDIAKVVDSRPGIRHMHHHHDPATSTLAAEAIHRHRSALQERVIDAFRRHGAMTDEDLESLPELQGYAPSTIRKRRSELWQAQYLRETETRPNHRGTASMTVWTLNLNENSQANVTCFDGDPCDREDHNCNACRHLKGTTP